MSPFANHGGALDAARRAYPAAPTPWIDLSTGINPQAYPVGAVTDADWRRLPDGAALRALEAQAARLYDAPPSVAVVATPGTQALIQRLPALLGGRDVRLLGRTYGEFAKVFSPGATVRTVPRLEDLAGADVAVVVNPNNPDGRLVAPLALVALARQVGGLIVDEAFMDPLGQSASLVPHLPMGRTVVLRSFGKFYGLAGLRLGFAVTASGFAASLRESLGPWAVSGPALAVGARALADAPWRAETCRHLHREAARLDALLTDHGLASLGGTPLFRLAAHPQAHRVFDSLAGAGLLTRPFTEEPTWLRFGLPDSPEAWARLAQALAAPRQDAATSPQDAETNPRGSSACP